MQQQQLREHLIHQRRQRVLSQPGTRALQQQQQQPPSGQRTKTTTAGDGGGRRSGGGRQQTRQQAQANNNNTTWAVGNPMNPFAMMAPGAPVLSPHNATAVDLDHRHDLRSELIPEEEPVGPSFPPEKPQWE
jgi:hypothetical protein